MCNGASRWGQAFDHWCLAVFFGGYTWLYKGVTFVFLLSFPLSLPLIGHWDVEYVSVVLFCYILDVMLCMCEKKNKKLLITKKKNEINSNTSWMAWGWVHFQQIFIFGWTIPLMSYLFECFGYRVGCMIIFIFFSDAFRLGIQWKWQFYACQTVISSSHENIDLQNIKSSW